MRVTAAIGLIGAGLVLAGCSAGTVSGDADAEGTSAGEPVFSPCDDIPSDLLRQANVDPASPDRDFGGVDYPGWNRCRWPGSDYSVSVLAATLPLEEIRSSETTLVEGEQSIGGRSGLVYRDSSDTRRERCNVAIATGDGSAIVRVSIYDQDRGPEPCELAVQTAGLLSPAIPR